MSFANIAAALALSAAATEDDIILSIGKLTGSLAAAAAKLSLPATSTIDEIVVAASAVDPAKYVAAEAFADMTRRLAALEGEKGEAVVAAAMKAGKIAPAQKEFWVGRMQADPVGTEAYLSTAPVLLAPGQMVAAAAATGGDGLTDAERSVAAMIGVKAEAFAAAKGA